jgi:CheY-like chemotaxis protein
VTTILIVEDDPDVRDAIADPLRRDGYRVVTAGNGREALDRLSAEAAPPAVIILDWMMPVMSGHDFLAFQMADRAYRQIPVLVLTALDTLTPADARFAAVLTKPVRRRTLLAVVARLSGMPPPRERTTGQIPVLIDSGPVTAPIRKPGA